MEWIQVFRGKPASSQVQFGPATFLDNPTRCNPYFHAGVCKGAAQQEGEQEILNDEQLFIY